MGFCVTGFCVAEVTRCTSTRNVPIGPRFANDHRIFLHAFVSRATCAPLIYFGLDALYFAKEKLTVDNRWLLRTNSNRYGKADQHKSEKTASSCAAPEEE
jgi:hypothetical protein